MGLVTGDDGKFVVLTDIEGMEDFYGDMDFKVAGTRNGITAIQMDIKIHGLPFNIMAEALEKAKTARMFILDNIAGAINATRTELSPYAPRQFKMQIDQNKIGTLIGPGGKTIRSIIEETKTTIDVDNDGTVIIGSPNDEGARKAIEIIESLTKDIEVGSIYTGKVTRLMNFGAFVEIAPGKEGLVHISELADYRVPKVEDVVAVGDEVMVKVIEIDNQGRINLSRKAVMEDGGQSSSSDSSERPASHQRPRHHSGSKGDKNFRFNRNR